MAGPFLSDAWHRVATMRPRLHIHAEVARHRARGQAWYSVRNGGTGKVYRMTPASYQFLGQLNGRTTVNAAWHSIAERLDENAPTQDEVISLLSQLHDADLLQTDRAPDLDELGTRRRRQARQSLWQHVSNPMSLRVTLWNPDRFLLATLPWVRPLVGPLGVVLWLAVVLPALVLAGQNWAELTDGAADRILTAENVVLLALVYPIVKTLHEFGHAYATRAGGGPVHDMGLMLLVLMPVPYVDASAASAFRSRWRRVGVGAAGMMVETFVAAAALYIWLLAEPGSVRTVAFTVMTIAGVSTVLFNGNPLLRYDGYFILSDLVAIPNLAARATRYWGWIVQRAAFGLEQPAPPTLPGERAWLVAYAPASLVARLSVMIGIAMLVATKMFVLGTLIALWTIWASLVWPLLKMAHHVVSSPALERHRRRAVLVTMGAVGAVVGAVLLVPAPLHTVAEGVFWLPADAAVRASADGFVQRLVAAPGTRVQAGDLLAEADDPQLRTKVAAGEARVAALRTRLGGEEFADRVRAAMTTREIDIEMAALGRDRTMLSALQIRSEASGTFTVDTSQDWPGRYLKRGERLGYVLPERTDTVRVIVRQQDIDLVRARLRAVRVLTSSDPERALEARMLREVPSGSDELPSRALSTEGGGELAIDPQERSRAKTLSRTFQFDLQLDDPGQTAAGAHVWARFDHGTEPVAVQAYRRLRQVFLSHFNA